MRIDAVEHLVLFGGGHLLLCFAQEARRQGVNPHVFAVSRHLTEVIDESGQTLEQSLQAEGIPVYPSSDINTAPVLKTLLKDKVVGVGLGEAYTFTRDTIEAFQGKLFDFMTIRLPQYRGGAHFTWQILRGHRLGAWHIQVINEDMVPGVFDSGEILKSREFVLPAWARIPADFFKVYNEQALLLFQEFLTEIQQGQRFPLARLQENFSLYFPRLHTKSHGYINWQWSTDEIERFVCAFDDPYPGASTFLDGAQRVFLKKCQRDPSEGSFHPFMAGLIYRITEQAVFVAGVDGGLLIRGIRNEADEDMHRLLRVGQRFYTPMRYLEQAMLFNAEYDTEGLKGQGLVEI